MKLTDSDKQILIDVGHLKDDLPQIEYATTKTKYTLDNGKEKKKISLDEAIKLLGRRNFLISLGRSAFHWNTSREIEGNVSTRVCFDSSALFRN